MLLFRRVLITCIAYSLLFSLCTLLRVSHVNSRSAVNKIPEIQLMIQTDKIDILFLSETWFHADLLDAQFQLDGYTLLRRDRAQHKTFRRGGGVAVYIRRTIQYRRRHDLEHHEHEVLAMDIATDSRQCPHITLLAYYRPPNDNMLTFCKDLEGTLHFASSNCPVIVVGDFNAKLSTWCSSDDDTREGLLLQDCLDTTGFQQVVTSPTRFSACGSTSSCLDLVAP